jgi:hypothetical protein
MFGLIFLPVTQRAISEGAREPIPCTLLRNYQVLLERTPCLIGAKVVYNITIEQNNVASLLFTGQNSSPPLRRMGNSFDTHLKSKLD